MIKMNQTQTLTDATRMTSELNTTVEDYIRRCNENINNSANELKEWHRPISKVQFWAMLKSGAEKIFLERGVKREFVCDDNNRHVIEQMYLYLIGSEKCEWNINKGIYLMGKVGCGKSVLLTSFLNMLEILTRHIIIKCHAKTLDELIDDKGLDALSSRPMMIDELGRENIEQNNFGKKIKPVIDLFSLRYERGGRTFVTSNFTLDTLESKKDASGKVIENRYGNFIRTRMDEMMNIVTLTGDNRREKYEM